MVFFAIGKRLSFTTNAPYHAGHYYGVTPEAFEEARAADVEAICARKAAYIQRWLPGRPTRQAIRADSPEEAHVSGASSDVCHPGATDPPEGVAGAGLTLKEQAKRQRAVRRELVQEALDLWRHRNYLLRSTALAVLLLELLLVRAGVKSPLRSGLNDYGLVAVLLGESGVLGVKYSDVSAAANQYHDLCKRLFGRWHRPEVHYLRRYAQAQVDDFLCRMEQQAAIDAAAEVDGIFEF
ncbi:hypothetical protein WJX72_003677 [[Myrmecia] bisecta]|uniref:Uncharacterized protein n=1 Tax=[Myrmecia] bisecta TaxID=41462 RepID=A0AAW1QPX7_9CHLO